MLELRIKKVISDVTAFQGVVRGLFDRISGEFGRVVERLEAVGATVDVLREHIGQVKDYGYVVRSRSDLARVQSEHKAKRDAGRVDKFRPASIFVLDLEAFPLEITLDDVAVYLGEKLSVFKSDSTETAYIRCSAQRVVVYGGRFYGGILGASQPDDTRMATLVGPRLYNKPRRGDVYLGSAVTMAGRVE